MLARQGSGSAARSMFGGFVEMHAGRAADGTDSFAEPLLGAAEWPLEVVIAVTAKGEKEVGSRSGMDAFRRVVSVLFGVGRDSGQSDLPLRATRFARAISPRSPRSRSTIASRCTRPRLRRRRRLLYWNGATVECVHAVRRLRAAGVPVFFTIDAGPQVKAICLAEARPRVEATLRDVPGVLDVLSSRLGPGAELR